MQQTQRHHYRPLLEIGVPIVIGQLGTIILGFADTLMIGHHSTIELGAAGLVNNIIYAAVAFVCALLAIGTNPVMTVGGMSKFLSYASQYAKPFNEISGVVTELQNALACAGLRCRHVPGASRRHHQACEGVLHPCRH